MTSRLRPLKDRGVVERGRDLDLTIERVRDLVAVDRVRRGHDDLADRQVARVR